MTSREILNEALPPSDDIQFVHLLRWLRECAFQLALINENRPKPVPLRHVSNGYGTCALCELYLSPSNKLEECFIRVRLSLDALANPSKEDETSVKPKGDLGGAA